MAGGPAEATSKLLGQLRLAIAKKENLLNPDAFSFLWVTDFPLLEWNGDEQRWFSMHHPFTSPADEDIEKLESDPGAVRAKAYDLVLNGSEIGGGSIRIHDAKLQARIFKRLGISDEEAVARFGFFLEALEYGTPPHGGIALGPRPHRRAAGRRVVDPRGHRVPEDRDGRGPDVGRAVARRRETAAGAASPDAKVRA